ncbi:MAG: hypothetical protein PWP09_825, partial [Thermotogota bacterium]|nr:hypothetical protein [Thermotogota bacterium]
MRDHTTVNSFLFLRIKKTLHARKKKEVFQHEVFAVVLRFLLASPHKRSLPERSEACSSMKFSQLCFAPSSQALTNDRYQKEVSGQNSRDHTTVTRLPLRSHQQSTPRKDSTSCFSLAFRRILRLQGERIHHTSQFLNYAQRLPSLTLANNYFQKDSTSCLSFLLATSMWLGNCL